MASRTGIRHTAGLLVSSIALVAIGVPAAPITNATSAQPPSSGAAVAAASDMAALLDQATAAVDPVTFVDMPPEFVALANWATGLFDAAELELPPIRFIYHGVDEQECGGYPGRHVVEGDVSVDRALPGRGQPAGQGARHPRDRPRLGPPQPDR